jgi:hypothetical protein
VLAGVVHLSLAFYAHKAGSVLWKLLVGLAYVFFGVYLIAYPSLGVVSLTLVLASLFLETAARDQVVRRVRACPVALLKTFSCIFPEIKTDNVRIVSLWSERKHFDWYEREWFPKVEEIIKPYLTTRLLITCTRSKPHSASILKKLSRRSANLLFGKNEQSRGDFRGAAVCTWVVRIRRRCR